MASIRTPIGILSFPSLFQPRARAPGAEPVYQLSLILDQQAQKDPQYAALRAAVAECIDAYFGPGKSRDAAFVRSIRLPFRPCEEKEYTGYDVPGGIYISPWSKNKPGIIDAIKQEVRVPDDVWPGMLARATVNPFGYNTSGNKGIGLGLNNVQIIGGDGPRLDGRKSAAAEFDEVQVPNAAAGLPADSPF